MMVATTPQGAAPAVPTVDTLRRARATLTAAIDGGADHLVELRDLIEDALIDALAARRRDEVA